MMIRLRTIGHGEISPDTVLMPTTDRAPKVLVIPTGDPEGHDRRSDQSSSKHYPKEKAWVLN